jgi:hypothetical protein
MNFLDCVVVSVQNGDGEAIRGVVDLKAMDPKSGLLKGKDRSLFPNIYTKSHGRTLHRFLVLASYSICRHPNL